MKDAVLINCVFLFPGKNSLQPAIGKYSERAYWKMYFAPSKCDTLPIKQLVNQEFPNGYRTIS
jgi:hypothetical protein